MGFKKIINYLYGFLLSWPLSGALYAGWNPKVWLVISNSIVNFDSFQICATLFSWSASIPSSGLSPALFFSDSHYLILVLPIFTAIVQGIGVFAVADAFENLKKANIQSWQLVNLPPETQPWILVKNLRIISTTAVKASFQGRFYGQYSCGGILAVHENLELNHKYIIQRLPFKC